MTRKQPETLAGRFATWAGALCLVHCILTAVGFGVLSAAGFGFLANSTIEFAILGVAVVAGGFAIWHGARRHHSWIPALTFVAGLGLIVASHFGAIGAGVWPLILGGILIATFNILNVRMQHRGCGCRTDGSGHAVVGSRAERATPAEPSVR